MVSVQLRKSWSDQQGRSHEPGTMVDVDVATLAQLQASGVVEEFAANGGGGASEDTGGGNEGDGGWVDPSDEDTDGSWVDPSSDDRT